MSMEKRYSPSFFRVGRDSILVKSTPCEETTVSARASAPGSFRALKTTDVRSSPVWGVGSPGVLIRTKRVCALAMSATPLARGVRP